MSKASIEMHLTLAGPRADVSALLLMAAEQGLLKAMDLVVEPTDNGASTPVSVKKVKPGRSRLFNPGARVVVVHDRVSVYPSAAVGRRGTVVRSVRRGKGVGVDVKWDDDPTRVFPVASSVLKAA